MQLHCVYCGATLPVTRILYKDEPSDIQAQRAYFQAYHDLRCGRKSVGIILETEAPECG